MKYESYEHFLETIPEENQKIYGDEFLKSLYNFEIEVFELDKVRKQLEEAIEVIKFYSSQYNWVESGRNNEKMRITFDDNSILTKIASNGFGYDYEFKCGGRRARQFLKSLEEK